MGDGMKNFNLDNKKKASASLNTMLIFKKISTKWTEKKQHATQPAKPYNEWTRKKK